MFDKKTMFQVFTRVLGSLLIGFGLGMVLSQNLVFSSLQYLSCLIVSLVLGGFLLALSWRGKKEKEQLTTEPVSPGEDKGGREGEKEF